MFENHWARKRMYGDYGNVMHDDWTFAKHQLSYRHIKSRENGEWYRIVVRAKSGLFGATKWFILRDVDTHEECCTLMHQFVDRYNEEDMNGWIERYHAKKKKKEEDDRRKEHCGYSLEGAYW